MTKTTMNPDELLAIKAGAELMEAMPYVTEEVQSMMQVVNNRAFEAIRKGKLTPELAVDLWMELNAYARLLKKLTTRVTVAHSTADKHQETLDIGD